MSCRQRQTFIIGSLRYHDGDRDENFALKRELTTLQDSEPFRLATSRPLGERSEPFLAVKRPTASDEVARGRPSSRTIWNPTKDFWKVYEPFWSWIPNDNVQVQKEKENFVVSQLGHVEIEVGILT